MQKKNVQKGFTLVELLIVSAIVAILVAIAFPAYSSYMQKVRRGDAREALLLLAENQEKHFLINREYSNNLADIDDGRTTSAHGYYDLSVVSNGQTYTVTALAVAGAGQASDPICGATVPITLTNTGVRLPVACWR